MVMNNIFTEMRIPQLGDANFQTDFTAFCSALKQNIERLISVHYTKGEPGNSVYTTQVNVGYSPGGRLTSISAGMLNTIFNCDTFDETKGISDVNNIIAGTGANIMVGGDSFTNGGVAPSIIVEGTEYKAIPALMNGYEGFNIDINIDKVTGEAYLASPYIFVDNRIAGLNRIARRHAKDEEIYKLFHDFSVAVYGKGTYRQGQEQDANDPATWSWEFEAVQIVPKLYFDDGISEFCWNINGQETGITAQGIKGDDGLSPSMLIAIGIKNGSKLTINKIQAIDENGMIRWAEQNSGNIWGYTFEGGRVEIEQPKANDMALVFFPDENHPDGNPFEYAFLGKTYITSTGVYVYIGDDADGRCDIFESIRLHDYWGLMLTINSNTTGAPRGYILPAVPGQSSTSPGANSEDKPELVHMTYSEKGAGATDPYGFAKLHSAPVRRGNPDPTRMSQNSNPATDHVGDWKIDYNMDVRGDAAVQGNAAIKGDASVQGDMGVQGGMDVQGGMSVRGDVDIHGNMTIRGEIIGESVSVTGKPFGTIIETPKIACMSRFKNVSYSLKRSIDSNKKTFGYAVVISGTLELNIGALSWFNSANCISAPHDAISKYGPNWRNIGSNEDAGTTDAAATNRFNATGCKQKSKLYNVVKYEIPFDITKEVESNPCSIGASKNIWGFKEYGEKTRLGDTAPAVFNYKNTRGNISLRSVVEGFNKKFITGHGQYKVLGSEISNTKDVDSRMYYDINRSSTVTLAQLTGSSLPADTKTLAGESKGIITSITDLADGSRTISQTGAQRNYAVYGKLRYAPYSMEFEYYFDLFTRVFEADYTSWKKMKGNTVNDPAKYYCSDMDYNIFLDVVPVGFVRYKQDGKEFHSPIWNAINVNNEGSNSIRANISKLNTRNSFGPSITIYDEEMEEAQLQQGGSGSNSSSGGTSTSYDTKGDATGGDTTVQTVTQIEYVGAPTGSQPQPDTPGSVTLPEFYTVANALVTDLYTETFSDTRPSNVINGPQSVILFGEDIDSQYIIGLFDNPNGDTIECLSVENLKTNYFDITPSLRFVENNVKICPNNVYRGTWKWNDNESAIQWESAEPVPVVIIPYEGYIGALDASRYRGYAKVGCGNFKSGENSGGQPITLDGVLMYPFTPCVIMMTPRTRTSVVSAVADGAQGKEGDEDGYSTGVISVQGNASGNQYSRDGFISSGDAYVIDAINDNQNDALGGNNGQHLLSNGRMMVTDGQISGMTTMIRQKPPVVPVNWDTIDSSIVDDVEQEQSAR